jgi:hypothetical protein
MVGLRLEARRLCSVLPFLYASRETVAALRMLIIYAGSPTIRCGAARNYLRKTRNLFTTPYNAHYCLNSI